MNYGRAIYTARSARGLSQEELSAAVGCSKQHISMLEASIRSPSVEMLYSIATACSTQVYVLALLASDEPNLLGLPIEQAHAIGMAMLTELA
jgi:transcriptional regulator with XRE-family HTH domain